MCHAGCVRSALFLPSYCPARYFSHPSQPSHPKYLLSQGNPVHHNLANQTIANLFVRFSVFTVSYVQSYLTIPNVTHPQKGRSLYIKSLRNTGVIGVEEVSDGDGRSGGGGGQREETSGGDSLHQSLATANP